MCRHPAPRPPACPARATRLAPSPSQARGGVQGGRAGGGMLRRGCLPPPRGRRSVFPTASSPLRHPPHLCLPRAWRRPPAAQKRIGRIPAPSMRLEPRSGVGNAAPPPPAPRPSPQASPAPPPASSPRPRRATRSPPSSPQPARRRLGWRPCSRARAWLSAAGPVSSRCGTPRARARSASDTVVCPPPNRLRF